MLVRGGSLAKDMSQYLIDEIGATKHITVLVNSSVVEATDIFPGMDVGSRSHFARNQ